MVSKYLTVSVSLLFFYLVTAYSTKCFAGSIDDMSFGEPNAPVSIIEYASFGCSHCAEFHINTYPKIKKEFIETGKVKFIFRNFPLDTPSLAAAMIAHCAGAKKYFGMVEIFFRSQQQWGSADNPLDALKKSARFGGMTNSKVDSCLENKQLLEHIQNVARHGQEKYKINSTPSFVINGKLISGALPYKDFKKEINLALGHSD